MGARIGAIALAVITAGMLADVLLHPAGTQAAGSAIVGVLRPSLQATTGQKIT